MNEAEIIVEERDDYVIVTVGERRARVELVPSRCQWATTILSPKRHRLAVEFFTSTEAVAYAVQVLWTLKRCGLAGDV